MNKCSIVLYEIPRPYAIHISNTFSKIFMHFKCSVLVNHLNLTNPHIIYSHIKYMQVYNLLVKYGHIV